MGVFSCILSDKSHIFFVAAFFYGLVRLEEFEKRRLLAIQSEKLEFWKRQQRESEATAFEFIPILRDKINKISSIDQLLHILRNQKLDGGQKAEIWHMLKAKVFANLIFGVYGLALLNGYILSITNVMSAYLFEESRDSCHASASGSNLPGRPIDNCRLFSFQTFDGLSLSCEYFFSNGLPKLYEFLMAFTESILKSIALDCKMGLETVLDLIYITKKNLENHLVEKNPATLRSNIGSYILPADSDEPYSFDTPEDGIYNGISHRDELRLIFNEFRNLMDTDTFHSIVFVQCDFLLSRLNEHISKALEPPPAVQDHTPKSAVNNADSQPIIPVAKLIPKLNSTLGLILPEKGDPLHAELLSLKQLNDFSMTIFLNNFTI